MAERGDGASAVGTAQRLRGGARAQERELRAQGRQTMGRLLEAGREVFDTRGFHAARVDDVVKLAETSHGTFYLYFSNKEDLLEALIETVAEDMRALAADLPAIDAGHRGHESLRSWMERFVEQYRRDGSIVRTWIEAETRGNRFSAVGAEVLGDFSGHLADRIAEANPRVDPMVASMAFVAMIERFLYISSALRGQLELDEERMVETLTTIIHTGVFGGRDAT